MVGVVKQLEHQIRCVAPLELVGGNERLHFTLNGIQKTVDLRIGALSKTLVERLPDKVIDLIEIAALVYAVDSSVSRGGLVDAQMGAKWHRQFDVEMAVRCPTLWNDTALKQNLEETLMFLSDDRFRFTFVQNAEPGNSSKYFDFGDDNKWKADSIVMFSGGLDSFAGVLEEIVERKNRVALISHHSSTKIAKVQKDLQTEIGAKVGPSMLKHIPIKIQLASRTLKEGTHRTRSFLFATLGVANAYAFGLEKVSFYENGIVSLNLSTVTNAVGTRATRTTHPQTLTRFSKLFSQILDAPYKIENPFFWRTKKDIVEVISKLGFAKTIAQTRSCADVHNSTKMHPHCGRCSQCIDRRFAMLAAGLAEFDPAEAYKVDLMDGQRKSVTDRENALSYVRSALSYEGISPAELEQEYSQITRSVAHLDERGEASLNRLAGLLRRHSKGVVGVMEETLGSQSIDGFAPNTLPRMFGEIKRALLSTTVQKTEGLGTIELKKHKLVFSADGKTLVLDEKIEITAKATRRLLIILAEEHLRSAGKGLEIEDYPTLTAKELMNRLGLADEGNVRRCISRSRTMLRKQFASAGYDGQQADELIENLPWSGYRLKPEWIEVRRKK